MITIAEWLNPTRAIGLVAYGTAVTCCAIAWFKSIDRRASRLAAVLVPIELLLLLDVALNWRWKLHDLFAGIAASHNEYASRRLPQGILLVFLFGIFLWGLSATWRHFRGRDGALLAAGGGIFSVVLWSFEVVSLHYVDMVLYTMVWKLMAVSVLWVAASAITSYGILREAGVISPATSLGKVSAMLSGLKPEMRSGLKTGRPDRGSRGRAARHPRARPVRNSRGDR